ncbi:MAG: efflux RND transporter permease subunit [Phycisphaerae bacterium]|nr:efflux RND transporter permease subunit [Phycisphaerae bacterium]MBN8597892.1 efflux RND transporter permease subunit [Planctomycetota bacterium]
MKSFTDIFIKKPVLALVINLIILGLGWKSIYNLPVRQYPRLESSAIIINTAYIGASAETIRGFVTTPIERAVSAIDGIDYIESSSTAGISTVTVRLRLNHPSNAALAEISARLNQVRSELPSNVESPVIEIQRTDKPYATFYISMTTKSMTLPQLNDYMARELQPELQTLPGVQRVGIEGPVPLAMRIWLDSDKLDALDITPGEVQASLVRNNFLATVGRTKGKEVQVDLMTDTDLRTAEEFRELIVRERDGTVVRLKDVARVELGSEEATGRAGFNLEPAIWFSVWPLPSANELDVAKALKDKLAEMQTKLAPGVTMTLAYDGTYYMENAIKEIIHTLIETVLIVGLVVFLFMGSLRTVLVPMVAMPISLVGACLAMLAMGFSLNLLTILAIVLAVGLVVDDAIVVVENVERHVREGKTPMQAAILGARELFGPVVAMTITLATVYAPIGFQGGLTGMLFREFAFTLAAAVVISGVVAVTLSPIMSAWMVPPGAKEGRFQRFVNHQFDALRRVYERALAFVLRMRWAVVIAAVFITAAGYPLYRMSRSELAPTEDEGIVFTVVQAAPDASLDYSLKYFDQVGEAFMSLENREFLFQVMQSPTFGFGGIKAKDWSKRKQSTTEMRDEVFPKLMMVSGVRAFPALPPPLPGAGQFDVEMMVTSTDEAEEMAQYAGALIGAAFGSGKFMYADSDLKVDLPQTRIVIDRDKVADIGLDLAAVGRDLSVLLSGGYSNRFNHEGRSYKVIPQVEDSARATPESVLNLKVRAADGGQVSVSSFVTLETTAAPRTLTRFQQRNSFKVYGGVANGVTKAEALAALEEAAKKILPAGYSLDYSGESRQIKTEGASLASTLGLAIGLIYLVLAAQFGSFRDPFIVLLGSVPLALTGALIFTFMGFTTINIYSQVGLITLVGLVAKNGILIVEFANHVQSTGASKYEAATQAAATRLRPILMTSAATVFGHFPLVLVSGAGAEARNSIGIVLVTGMTISTVFTLFVVPCIYTILAGQHKPAHTESDGLPDASLRMA